MDMVLGTGKQLISFSEKHGAIISQHLWETLIDMDKRKVSFSEDINKLFNEWLLTTCKSELECNHVSQFCNYIKLKKLEENNS